MLWENESIENIIGGKTSDGVSLLKLFLTDYSNKFNQSNLCATCSNLIAEYHRNWINNLKEMENTSKYRLHLAYEGIPLEFGSSIYVNNANITDEYGAIIFKNRGSKPFSKFPTINESMDEPKLKASRRAKKR